MLSIPLFDIVPAVDNKAGECEKRPTKDEHYLEMAATHALRSPCLRRKYGAIIVKDDRVIGWGYNGPARGQPHCTECKRDGCKHNSGYTDDCPAVHAELNALIQGDGSQFKGATLYLAGWIVEKDGMRRIEHAEPCVMCQRDIINAQIKEVIG